MTMDSGFRALLDATNAVEMPPLSTLPPAMIREGYRAQRVGVDAGAPTGPRPRERNWRVPGRPPNTPGA